MVLRRKKPAAIGAKAKYPGFIEPAFASSIERCQAVSGGCARSSSMATVQVHLANNEIRVPDDLSAL